MRHHVRTVVLFTVSDSCYTRTKTDASGPALVKNVQSIENNSVIFTEIVPDSETLIKEKLIQWSQTSNACDVILTTGGTGFSPRDVTPEATKAVIDKETPGLTVAMTAESLKVTHLAALSRSVCGIRNKTLIINLPGSAKGATECFGFIKNAIPHAVALLTGQNESVIRTHEEIQSGFSCRHGQSKVGLFYRFF